MRRLLSSFLALLLVLVSLIAAQGVARAETAPLADPDGGAAVTRTDAVQETPTLSSEELSASAAAFASGSPVEIASMTTAETVTRALPDGTFESEISSEPVRVKDAEGWHKLDTTLKPIELGGESRLVPGRTLADVSLGRGGSDVMAFVGDHQGAAVTQRWPFGTLPEPVVAGTTAMYPEVLPGVDLVQLVRSAGVSQVLKVKTREALTDPRMAQMRFFLHADGATVKDRGVGKGLVAEAPSGVPALQTAEGQWWDSSWEGSTAEGPGGPGLNYPLGLSLGSEGGQQVQKLGMDAILAAKELTFPVFVDPDWTVSQVGFTYVDSGFPYMSYWNGTGGSDGTVHVGFLDGVDDDAFGIDHTTRGYYQFNTSGLAGKKIIKSVMNVMEKGSYSCSPRAVSAWITGGVSSGTTWNSQPGQIGKASTQNVAKGYSASCPAGQVGFDMGTTKDWLPSSPQWTVRLTADSETDRYAWKRFAGAASLITTYSAPPNKPTIRLIEGGLWDGTAWAAGSRYVTRYSDPNYVVFASDPDPTGGSITVTMAVKLRSTGAVKTTGTSAPGSPAAGTQFTWNGSAIADGDYVLEAYATDAQGLKSGTMSFNFTVDTTPPKSPKITAPASVTSTGTNTGSASVVPGQDALSFTLSDGGSYGVDSFVYAVTKGGDTVTYPGNMACGTRSGPFVSVCATSSSATISVGAIDQDTVIRAWAVDRAGNVNTNTESTLPTTFTLTTSGQAPMPQTLLTVTPTGGAAWKNIAVSSVGSVPAASTCSGGVTTAGPDQRLGRAFEAGPSGARGTTAEAAVDASKAFTVSAWVCPRGTAVTRSIMTQLAGSTTPAARLAITSIATKPQYVIQGWVSSGTAPDTVSNVGDGVQPGVWSYVVGAFDPINRQMRITVNSAGIVSTWITATSSASHLASATSQPVVLGDSGTAGSEQFLGQVFQPVFAQGLLKSAQIGKLDDAFGETGEEGLLK